MSESYSVEARLTAKDEMSSVLAKAGSNAESLGSKLKNSAIFGLGFKAVSGVINMVSNSVGSAVSRFDQLNNFPKVMANMKIPIEDSQKAMDKLSEKMAKLPTSLDTATAGVQRFTSANGDIEKSTDYFLALNDAVIAGGGNIQTQQSAIEQLSQAYSKGKMDMMEWRTLQQAMPAQLKQVAEAMGMTADSLGEGLRSGDVSMDEFMQKIVELDQNGGNGFKSYKEQAEQSCDGINTALANVKTAITRGVDNAFTSVDEALKSNGLMSIGETINSIIPKIDELSSAIGEKLGGAISFLAKHKGEVLAVVSAFGAFAGVVGVISVIDKIKTSMVALNVVLMANPAMLVVAGITALAVGLITAYKHSEKFRNAVNSVGNALKSFVTKIVSTAKSIKTTLTNAFKSVTNIGKNIIKGLWNGASSMVSWVVGKFKSLGSSILKGIKGALGIHSPSKVFRDEVGKNIMRGIVEGIEQSSVITKTMVNAVMPNSSGQQATGTVYNFGDITLDAKSLEDVMTVQDFVNRLTRAKAFV